MKGFGNEGIKNTQREGGGEGGEGVEAALGTLCQ